jgi:hypothetical protein
MYPRNRYGTSADDGTNPSHGFANYAGFKGVLRAAANVRRQDGTEGVSAAKRTRKADESAAGATAALSKGIL